MYSSDQRTNYLHNQSPVAHSKWRWSYLEPFFCHSGKSQRRKAVPANPPCWTLRWSWCVCNSIVARVCWSQAWLPRAQIWSGHKKLRKVMMSHDNANRRRWCGSFVSGALHPAAHVPNTRIKSKLMNCNFTPFAFFTEQAAAAAASMGVPLLTSLYPIYGSSMRGMVDLIQTKNIFSYFRSL